MHQGDCGWMAGLFDGEGGIGIHRSEGRLTAAANLGMTDEATVRHFHKLAGFGSVVVTKTPKGKPFYRWSTGGAGAAKLAEMLEPYLITNAHRARIVREFQQYKAVRGWARVVPTEDLENQRRLYEEYKKTAKH